LSLFLVFFGLVLIYHSDIKLITSVYVLLAIISGLIVGFWNTLSKKVSNTYSEFQMMLLDSSSSLLIGTVGSLLVGEKLPPNSDVSSWFWVIIFALSGIAATFFLIRGFKYIEAQVGSLILPMELLFASIFGYLIFGEILSVYVYIGGLLIAIASITPNILYVSTSL